MSSLLDATRSRRPASALPHGEVVASFADYQLAQAAIDRLGRADFPITSASILGSELKSVERVTARLSYGRAAAVGALRGAWFGVFFGLLTVLVLAEAATGQLLIAVVSLAVGFGALFSIVSYSVLRRRRDFASVSEVVASRYDIVVSGELAARARGLLDAALPGSTESSTES